MQFTNPYRILKIDRQGQGAINKTLTKWYNEGFEPHTSHPGYIICVHRDYLREQIEAQRRAQFEAMQANGGSGAGGKMPPPKPMNN